MSVTMTLWSVQVPAKPTFYLDKQVQGISTAEHAAKVASNITGEYVDPRNCMAINYEVNG